jgi:agmatine deiminase
MKAEAAKKGGTATPRELGYSMPAEWERHEAIWLSWPHDPVTFSRLAKVEAAYVEIIKAIHRCEEVRLFVRGAEMEKRVRKLLSAAKVDPARVKFYTDDYADVWFRDYGPTFVLNRKEKSKAMVHWIFNAWGNKYEELKKDTRIPEHILGRHPMPCFRPGIVMEGGSFDVNGEGLLLTTEQCLLNKNRNPRLDKKALEKILSDNLGVDRVLWLKEGVAGDDTDGHIDDIARFVKPDTVVCAYEDDEKDENHKILRENYELLRGMRDRSGKKLTVIKLPMPGYVGDKEGRLPASYANFYIGTDVVLVPTFGHPNDAKAIEIIKDCFPGRNAVGIRCEDVVHGLGTLHCISQQEPSL